VFRDEPASRPYEKGEKAFLRGARGRFYVTTRINSEKWEKGAGKLKRWGVPDGTRDRASGEPVHDDDLITSAMCAMLDRMEWRISVPTTWIAPKDPLEEMDRNF
jgi:hypothetical protein